MRIIVTDGEQRSALATVRSLGAAGHQVTVGAATLPCLAGVSSRAARAFAYANPANDPTAFVSDIIKEALDFDAELILPMTDLTVFALAQAVDRLPSRTGLFQASLEKLRLAADKVEMFKLAEKLGVPVPASVLIESPGAPLSGIGFPVVVKPRRSRVESEGRVVATGVSYADDPATLREILSKLPEGAFPVLLQEKMTGEGVGYFALATDGRILAEFYHRRLRELPPSGGVSVLREAIGADETMRDAGRALLAELRWTGPAMVEFKRDEAGTPRLMEINGRFWGSLQLAVDAGADFPALLVRAFAGESFDPPKYRTGTRTQYLLGDLEALATVLVKGRRALPSGTPSRLAYLLEFFRQRGRLEIIRLGDMKPFLLDLQGFAAKAWSILKSHLFPTRIRGIIHCHSNFSYDAKLRPERLALHLETKNLAFACLTDHDISLGAGKFRDLVSECGRVRDFALIPGVEFTTTAGTHVLGLGIRDYFEERDPVAIVRGIRAGNGLAILAHPDNSAFERDAEFLKGLHGVEIWNSDHDGPFVPSYKNLLAFKEIRKVNPGVLAFGGLDFHERGNYRGMHMVVSAPPEAGPDSIMDALKEGRFRTVGLCFSASPKPRLGAFAMLYVRSMRALIAAARPCVHWLRAIRKKLRPAGAGPSGPRRAPVLHTIETGNPGGAENMMLSLVDNLPPASFESHAMLLKEGWLHDQLAARGVPTKILRMKTLGDWKFTLLAAGICRRSGIRIIQSHEMYMNVQGALAAKLSGARHVAVVHGNLSYLAPFRRRLAYWITLMLGTEVVTVSRALREELAALLRISESRIRVIHNGVTIPPAPDARTRSTAKARLGVEERRTVAIIGSLYRIKGHEILLSALPEILKSAPDLKVLFIGRGREDVECELAEKARVFGDAVEFLGFRTDVPDILPAVDVLAVPSFYEGLSLTLCEAMASGIPAVATRVGGNPEVVSDGRDGFLVPAGDPAALAERIARLLTDESLRAEMGAAARQKIIEHFSLEQMVRRYHDLYDELLGRD